MTVSDFYAVVPAGGAGTRLWPLSRQGAPKFLHDLTGAGKTLLQSTWDRLTPLAEPDHVLVVTGEAHAQAVNSQLPRLQSHRILTEPSPRDSMAAIGLAAAIIGRENPNAIMGSFAADHNITDEAGFHDTIRAAIEVARGGELVTIGIKPTWASTGFGYISGGDNLGLSAAFDALRVEEFVEKPTATVAESYVESGNYLWNAGMFVVRVNVLLGYMLQHQPELHNGLTRIAAAWGTEHQDEVMEAVWPGLVRIAIDHAIAEPVAAAGGVAVVPGSFGWDDVGDWKALAELLPSKPEGHDGITVLGDDDLVLSHDATGLVAPSGNRIVAVLGLQDVVIVDTPDAVLVTTRERAQEVKGLVNTLKDAGRIELI